MCSFLAPPRPVGDSNVYTDCSLYPMAVLSIDEEWQGAIVLMRRGRDAFRKFILGAVRLPSQEADRKELAESIARDFEMWTWMNEDWPDDPDDELEGQDAVMCAWARAGEMPPLIEAIAELSMPWAVSVCEEAAAKYFPGQAEKTAEREELVSYRVERWVKATTTLKDQDWLSRAALWTSYETWCRFDSGGHEPGKPEDFYAALQELGFVPSGRKGKRGFKPPKH